MRIGRKMRMYGKTKPEFVSRDVISNDLENYNKYARHTVFSGPVIMRFTHSPAQQIYDNNFTRAFLVGHLER